MVALVHLLQVAHAIEQGNSFLTAFLIAKTCYTVIGAYIGQALEVLAFIYKQIIYAKSLKGKFPVYLSIKQIGELGFKIVLSFLQTLYLLLGKLGFVLLTIKELNGIVKLCHLLVNNTALHFLRVWQHTVLVMAQYHAVIVIEYNLSHEFLAVVRCKVLFSRCQYACCRICLTELLGNLGYGGFQSDNHRLLGNTHTTHFHDGTLHHKGFTSTHNMVHYTTAVVDKHPDSIFLMRSQFLTHKSGNIQVRAIELTQDSTIELIIVQSHQLFLTLRLLPNPILKGCTQILYLIVQ